MKEVNKKRILLGKMGLDAHDTGIQIVAKWLSDAGYEVVYGGLYNTAERICQTAIQEDVDLIGCSFLGGGHQFHIEQLLTQMKERGIESIKIMVGGVIPPADVNKLKEIGVSLVFTPGTLRENIIEAVKSILSE
jgi:methylmalonyl-CoA mutase C-terminal domain/subunit